MSVIFDSQKSGSNSVFDAQVFTGLTLVGSNSTQTNTSSTGAISEAGTVILTGSGSNQTNTSSSGSITDVQSVALSGDDSAQSNSSSSGAISNQVKTKSSSLTGKPSLTTPSPFVNDGFWFDLDIGELMSKYRIPAEYADDTIKWGLTLALVNVNLELDRVKDRLIELGYTTADAYVLANPREMADSDSFTITYRHAVYSYAKAFLLQQFNSLNRKPTAEAATKEAPDTEQWWHDQSAKAVAQLFARVLPDTTKIANRNVFAVLI